MGALLSFFKFPEKYPRLRDTTKTYNKTMYSPLNILTHLYTS